MSVPKPTRWIPWRSGIAIVGVVIYFIMPFDLIPDAFWIVGVLDDATIAALVLRWVLKDYRNHVALRDGALAAVRAQQASNAEGEGE